MTLQVKKDGFVHDGREYAFRDVRHTLYSPAVDRLSITLNEAGDYRVITIQCEHVSALMLGFARWSNDKR